MSWEERNERVGRRVLCGSARHSGAARPAAGAGQEGARKECVVFASGETNAFKRRGYTMAA